MEDVCELLMMLELVIGSKYQIVDTCIHTRVCVITQCSVCVFRKDCVKTLKDEYLLT